MVSVEIRFTAGRYHATPWGRHVNEGAMAWPPEPWRVLRALVAVWHRKALAPESEPVLERLVEKLAATLPIFRLPVASHSHTRHYMPVREGRSERRLMVFDGFLQVASDDPLTITWPEVILDREEEVLLDRLLAGLGYFGRAESWTDARRTSEPASGTRLSYPADSQTGDSVDLVDVLVPLSPAEYSRWREESLATDIPQLAVRGKKLSELKRTIPERFLDLLRLDTADWQAAGWSRIPGTRWVRYARPADWDLPERRPAIQDINNPTTARFAIIGRPLPRVEDSVRAAEWFRAALMSKAGERGAVPSVLSGRTAGGLGDGHRHAFVLPEDADGDGWIDHVLVHADDGLADIAAAMGSLRYVTGGDRQWRVLLEGMSSENDFSRMSALVGPSKVWISTTPYLHPWYRKRAFGPAEQIAREVVSRGNLPRLVAAEPIERIEAGRRSRLPVHFHRFRSRRGLTQPDTQGSFWRLEFSESFSGPLSLGFGAHFGLGLFRRS